MMVSVLLMNFIGILRETFKFFIKNFKIFASIALFTLVINSIGYLCNFYTIKPLFTDLFREAILLNNTTPGTPEFLQVITQIKNDAEAIICFESIYNIIYSAFVVLSTTATILAAAILYGEKEQHLSLKDLVLKTVKSWLGPFFTWLCVLFFTFLYFFVSGVIIFILALIITNDPRKLIFVAIPLGVIALVLYMYLSVTWVLAIVISVLENMKGTKAIRKAGEIIKGVKLQGFMVIALLNVLTYILQLGIQQIPMETITLIVVRGVAIVYLSSLVNMYQFGAFTVIYYMCKKNHGERVELERSEYIKIATTPPPLVDDKLP